MRIAIDASCILPARTGIGNYTYHLCRELVERAPQHQFKLLLNSLRHRLPDNEPLLTFSNVRPCRRRIPGPWLLRSWQHLNFPPVEALIGGFDLFHATASIVPPRLSGKCVVTVHDLYFKMHPEHSDALGGMYLEKTLERSLRRADAVIAVSNSTRRDLLRYYRVPESKVHVIYEAADARMIPPDNEEKLRLFRSEFCLPDVYLLTVGTLEPRKNLPGLFRAYAVLKKIYQYAPPLVVVGIRGWKSTGIFRTMVELGIADDVIFTEYVDEMHMPLIYGAARVFVFPSFYEGFGLPVVEAMACGVPVVSSDAGALREVAGEAAILVDPADVEGMARAIKSLLGSSARRRALRDKGLENARRFSWRLAARKTIRVYEAALDA